MSRSSAVVALVCCAALVNVACAAHRVELQDVPSEAFVGHATADATGTWFAPCGSVPGAARLWVTFTGASVQQAERAKASGLLTPGQPTFVRWNAARTDGRDIGPGGPALLVRDIVEVRAPRAGDCPGGADD